MKISNIIWTVVCVITLGAVVSAIWYDETIAQPAKAAEFEAMTTNERYGLRSVCLNGVEYWMNAGTTSRSWMLSPKYSPGNVAPDTCGE